MASSSLYQVKDGNSYIGTFYALNEKQAIAKAASSINADRNAFRKQGYLTLKQPVATKIERTK